MRRLVRIVFLFVALLYVGGMIYQIGYFTYFKINQEEIAAEFCVNKAKPEMHCNGQCHLKKELEKGRVFDFEDQTKNEQERLPQIHLEVLLAVFPDSQSDSNVNVNAKQLYLLAWDNDYHLIASELENVWHPPQV